MLQGIVSFVWQDAPGRDADGVDAWAVKAANGNGHTSPEGFDFRANARAWAADRGTDRVHGWTWLYHTTDGVTAARELVESLPHAPGYGIDVEGDDPGVTATLDIRQLTPVVQAFCAEMRRLRPDADLWFTSYPDRWQAVAHGAPWDALVAGCDYGLPQVYYAEQAARWPQIVADHKGKPVVPALSPGDWTNGWAAFARQRLLEHCGLAIWRYPGTRNYASYISALARLVQEDDVTPEDIARIADETVRRLRHDPIADPRDPSKQTTVQVVWSLGARYAHSALGALADVQDGIGKLAQPMSDTDRQALAADISARVDKLRVIIQQDDTADTTQAGA